MAGAVILAACSESRTPVPVLELGAANDTVLAPYSEVTAATWLGAERWAVLAPGDRMVAIVDFDSHHLTPLGPATRNAYDRPFSLFRTGDSLYVGDWGLRRLTIWSSTGRLADSVAASPALRGALPRARDASGNWYLEMPPRAGPDGAGNRDSIPVVRTPSDFSRQDTIARLAPLDVAEVNGDAGHRFEPRLLSGKDRWGVLPDGSLWVARVLPSRVDWRAPDGETILGQPLPDRVLPVTEADREIFLRRFPPDLRSPAEQLPFAAVKPPFVEAFAGPDGTVWLEQSRAYGDTLRTYQLVDRAGKLIRRIQHRDPGRLVSVSPTGGLMLEQYAEGVRALRVALPSVTGQ